MTPIEFLARLRLLPAATSLSLPHVAATLEMLTNVLLRRPDSDVEQRERWAEEAALARWLGEPVITIESWRLDGSGTRQYRLGAVLAWLDGHMVPLENSDASTDDEASRLAEACWTNQIPALVVDGHLIGFFRSLNLETEPQGYVLVQDGDARALVTAKITPADAASLLTIYQTLGAFAQKLGASPDDSLKIWNDIRAELSPELALQFFLAAASQKHDIAMKIVADLDATLLRSRWNLAGWMWELFLNHDLCDLNAPTLVSACAFAMERGVDLNGIKSWRDSLGYPVFNGNLAHLLADTFGDHFKLDLQAGFGLSTYNQLLIGLLELKLDVNRSNHDAFTAQDISDAVQTTHGASPFEIVLNAYSLSEELTSSLSNVNGTKRRKQPV